MLLAHQPRSAAAAERAGFDLQLSGHTHGGQFLPWNLFVPLQQPFTAGLHRLRQLWVYTSRGTGYWGPPKRFGAPSEITPAAAGRRPRRRRAATIAQRAVRSDAGVLQSAGFAGASYRRRTRILPCSFPKPTPRAAAPAAAPTPPFGGLAGMLPLVLMFVVLYFLMIRPQMKRRRSTRR